MTLTDKILDYTGRQTLQPPDAPVCEYTLRMARQGKYSRKTRLLIMDWLDVDLDELEPDKRA